MSLKWSEIRWGRVVLGVILAVAIFVVVPVLINVGYGVVLGFQMRGSPPNEAIMEFALSTPVLTSESLGHQNVLYLENPAPGGCESRDLEGEGTGGGHPLAVERHRGQCR